MKRVLLLVLCWRQRGGFTGIGGDANAARTCMVVVGVGCLRLCEECRFYGVGDAAWVTLRGLGMMTRNVVMFVGLVV